MAPEALARGEIMPESENESTEIDPGRAAPSPLKKRILSTHRPDPLLPPEELSPAAQKEWLVRRAERHGMMGSGN